MIDPTPTGEGARRLAWNRGSLLSSVGAGLAGIGLGTIWPQLLAGIGGLLLGLGFVIHVAGMFAKRRAERSDRYEPKPWEKITYWSCWIAILGLMTFLLLRASSLA